LFVCAGHYAGFDREGSFARCALAEERKRRILMLLRSELSCKQNQRKKVVAAAAAVTTTTTTALTTTTTTATSKSDQKPGNPISEDLYNHLTRKDRASSWNGETSLTAKSVDQFLSVCECLTHFLSR